MYLITNLKLSLNLTGERSSKLVIQKELDILKEKLNQQTVNKASQAWSQRKSVSEALDVAHKQIEALHKEKSELNRECELLKQKMEKVCTTIFFLWSHLTKIVTKNALVMQLIMFPGCQHYFVEKFRRGKGGVQEIVY